MTEHIRVRPQSEPEESPVSKTPALWWALLVALLMGVAAAWGWKLYRQSTARNAPPVYGAVSDFTLIERSGQPFGLSDLRGRIWIVNFFFSHCTEICPRTMPELARLQQALPDEGVALVSITVDPANDTPAVLTEFAQRFQARPGRWFFLTGDRQTIYDLSLHSFHMAVDAAPRSAHTHPGNAFLHDGHFALVDGRGQIRGYYDGLDPEALGRLAPDVQLLLREK